MPTTTTTSSPPTTSTANQGGDFTTQAALSLTRAAQTNNFVASKAYYDISFRTSTTGTIKTVEIDFPPGTYVGAAVLVEATGIGPGTIAASGTTGTGMKITYTVTSAVNVPALTKIRIQIANVNNPATPSASLTVSITTRDSSNAIIDGPTPTNAYNMDQIGTGQIEDGAITGNKIAGTTKLIFGVCTGDINALVPGQADDLVCPDSNAEGTDEIVGFWSSGKSDPAPVLINGLTLLGSVAFGFENTQSVNTAAQSPVEVSYIIFKK
jgi:hypothetical protein